MDLNLIIFSGFMLEFEKIDSGIIVGFVCAGV